MSDTPWTPGPWTVGKDEPEVSYDSESLLPSGWHIITGRSPPFAFGRCVGHVAESADARLIAAAPELAETLDELLTACLNDFGDPDDGYSDTESVEVGERSPITFGMLRRARSALRKARGEQT